MVVIETVGVGQAETDVADVADTVVVVVQPGSGDVLQFLKSGIMESPTCSSSPRPTSGRSRSRRAGDLAAALRSLGARSTPVLAVSSVPPPSGIEELVDALEEHREAADLAGPRTRPAAARALPDFQVEHGERGLRAIGGRARAQELLGSEDPGTAVPALVGVLERSLAG